MPTSPAIDRGIACEAAAAAGARVMSTAALVSLLVLSGLVVLTVGPGCHTAVSTGHGSGSDGTSRARSSSLTPGDAIAYYESGAYLHDITEIATRAKAWIDLRAGQPRRAGERLVLVLDVDDTALSNFPGLREVDFQWSNGDTGGGNAVGNAARDAWRQRASAPVIAPILDLFHFALARKVEVVFISERTDPDLREATERNLRAAGYVGYTKLVMRPARFAALDTSLWKADARRELVFEGGKIIAAIGDQPEDTEGPFIERAFRLPALPP
ncbi:hypothetical protein Ga0100231_001025 [Opitutaceae bacterium TAV4]|uniref:HAD family acid phosphatase n=1 Tax=Geminisphaera colitermitum TaxID=1148786 RepID=UPI000158C665|nr:HAD family acid phosphatase [Geminisphaera colitermitum]RRJ98956.1 hypothetical protein Ga0100230_011760 [Opitutaceae bacterium TAV3]RRK01422.1 hypothetical protein Ga0100231_001025 [Opitutaceae bacterium TAV4]